MILLPYMTNQQFLLYEQGNTKLFSLLPLAYTTALTAVFFLVATSFFLTKSKKSILSFCLSCTLILQQKLNFDSILKRHIKLY